MEQGFRAGRDGLLKEQKVSLGEQAVKVPVGQVPRKTQRMTGADAGPQAEVKTVRGEDGTVRQITVRCPCDREITLQCEYLGQGEQDE